MTQSKKKIILLTTSLILTICLMAFFGVYALTILKNSTFNVGVKYEPEYLVKVEMGIDGANGGTVNQTIEENEYVEIFNSLNPVSNGMYIDSMSNETIHINSQTLTPIGANGDVYFRITSLENETSGNKDLKCVIDCGSSTADSGTMASGEISNLKIATGIDATSGTVTSSSLGMIKISLKFSRIVIILNAIDLKDLKNSNSDYLDFGKLGIVPSEKIAETEFYVSDIDGLLTLSALVGQVNTTTTEYGSNYGYDNSLGPAITFSGATIQMLNNIDFKNGDNKDNFSKKFIPIGNSSANSFQGTFDGNDKTITGLYINQTTDNVGLFGCVLNAEIKDLTMQNCKVVGGNYSIGNFVGWANGLTISNCSAKETEVSGSYSYVGGLVGCANGATTITNCYNTGNVSGTRYDGGIVGYLKGTATITNCYNTGSVSGSDIGDGGIVGYVCEAVATIMNCYNTGSVSGARCVGGIVGTVDVTATIRNCYNTGSVSGSSYVGGILGDFGSSVVRVTITNCYNTGSVSSSGYSFQGYVGGIVGYGYGGTATITNCYNTGSVSKSGNVQVQGYGGGIVGYIDISGTATITNCYNKGNVRGNIVGGIVGYVANGGTATITNCYYLKTSSVNANLNGVGVNDGTLTSTSYFGTFSSARSNVVKTSSANLVYSGNILNVLNAYRKANPTYNGITLNTWVAGSDGYPVFA